LEYIAGTACIWNALKLFSWFNTDYVGWSVLSTGHLVYGSHVSDHVDLAAVQSVVRACLSQPSTLWGRGQHILSDINNFTGRFGMQAHTMTSISQNYIAVVLSQGVWDPLGGLSKLPSGPKWLKEEDLFILFYIFNFL